MGFAGSNEGLDEMLENKEMNLLIFKKKTSVVGRHLRIRLNLPVLRDSH